MLEHAMVGTFVVEELQYSAILGWDWIAGWVR